MDILENEDIRHKGLIVIVNKNWDGKTQSKLYDAARFAWGVDTKKAKEVKIVLASYYRKIVGVFEVEQWLPSTHPIFEDRQPNPNDKRYGFIGHEAPACIADHYVGKRVSHNVKTGRRSFGYVPRKG